MLAGVGLAASRAAIHAVRVQIIPAPRSLVDSREILRILQSYGEVTTYRWLKHDALSSAPNSAMAIFADGEAMNRFLHECPLTFEIDRTEREEETVEELENGAKEEGDEFTPVATVSPSASGNELQRKTNILLDMPEDLPKRKPASTSQQKKQSYLTRPQLFRVNADTWRGKHRDWLERHPFWGNFQPKRQTIVAQDLAKRVPLIGLCDIDANSRPEIPIRFLDKRKEASAKRPTVRDMIRDLRGDVDVKASASGANSGHWG